MKKGFYLLFLLIIAISSCIPKKKFYYFQKSAQTPIKDSVFTNIVSLPIPEHILATGDIVEIRVEEANLVTKSEVSLEKAPTVPSYAVDAKGKISLPLVGFLDVSGKTCHQIQDTLLNVYQKYYRDPYVSVSLKSFRVSVLGEVRLPGIKQMDGEHATIIDAISMSNDLTDEGKRINIKLFRRNSDNKYKEIVIDISSINVFRSEGFFLQSNDIIYVSSVNSKRQLNRSNSLVLVVTLLNSFMIFYSTL